MTKIASDVGRVHRFRGAATGGRHQVGRGRRRQEEDSDQRKGRAAPPRRRRGDGALGFGGVGLWKG
jgi:hypothetical protein